MDTNEIAFSDLFDEKVTTVCFTGHREIAADKEEEVRNTLSSVLASLYARGARIFKAGGALGFDTMAAIAVIALRAETDDDEIKLKLYLPAPDQAENFPESDKKVYEIIKGQASDVFYSSDEINTESFLARNRRLVEGSDVCVAYCTESKGGSYYTCRLALSEGVELINIADLIDL